MLVADEKREVEGPAVEGVLVVRAPVPVLVPATVAVLFMKELGRRTPPVSVPEEPRVLLPCSLACCRNVISHLLVAAIM